MKQGRSGYPATGESIGGDQCTRDGALRGNLPVVGLVDYCAGRSATSRPMLVPASVAVATKSPVLPGAPRRTSLPWDVDGLPQEGTAASPRSVIPAGEAIDVLVAIPNSPTNIAPDALVETLGAMIDAELEVTVAAVVSIGLV